MKRICLLTDEIPKELGGRPLNNFRMANKLIESGNEVVIICPALDIESKFNLKNYIDDGLISNKIKYHFLIDDLIPNNFKSENGNNDRELKKRTNIISKNSFCVIKEIGPFKESAKYKKNNLRSKKIYYNNNPLLKLTSFEGILSVWSGFKFNDCKTFPFSPNNKSIRTKWFKSILKDYRGSVFINSARNLDYSLIRNKSWNYDIKVYSWIHNPHKNVSKNFDKVYKKIFNKRYKKNKIIVLTEEQRKDIVFERRWSFEDILILPRDFNIKKSVNISQDFDFNKVVTISRFHESQKRLTVAIKAFSEFKKNNENFTFDIYGQGNPSELKKLEKCIKELNLNDCVRIVGWADNVEEIFKSSSAFIISSKYGGLDTTINESIRCGCPVASSNFKYGPNDIIANGINGYIAKNLSYKSLAKAIEKTVEINEYFSRESISRSINNFDKKNNFKNFLEELLDD